jgi:predicted AAA+ superfamily ATPase
MERFNPWWKREPDEVYEEWQRSPVKWVPEEIRYLSLRPFSLNFLSGPRQVGKTTAVKLLVAELLKTRPAESIFYFSCDELSDHRELGEVLDGYLRSSAARGIKERVVFLDEVTAVRDWWRAVKSRVDDGSFRGDSVTVTGSASLELMKQREMFPGRRGNGTDVMMHPRSFSQYVSALGGPSMVEASSLLEVERAIAGNAMYEEDLSRAFLDYLQTGGFPRSIIEMRERGRVGEAPVKTLLDWLRADWARAGRNDRSMKEVIAYILRARGTPVSWLGIARETSIGSPHTTQAYVETLEGLMVALVLELITPQGRVVSRRNRKIHFTDPLVYRAFSVFSGVELDEPALVEATVASHLSRRWRTYYWKDGTEVDVVVLEGGRQVGIETKWGFKKGSRPRHLSSAYLSLDRRTVPLFLASFGGPRLAAG